MLKKVNTATKFSTVKTQICGIKLGTPNTALQSCPYYGHGTGKRNARNKGTFIRIGYECISFKSWR